METDAVESDAVESDAVTPTPDATTANAATPTGSTHIVRAGAPRRALALRVARVPRAAHIVALYLASEIAIRLLRLERASRLFSVSLDTSPTPQTTTSGIASGLSPKEIADIGLVRRIGAHWPSPAGPCLREALVAGHVVRRHGPALLIGARLGGASAPIAHAWLRLADGTQIGDLDGYSVLGSAVGTGS